MPRIVAGFALVCIFLAGGCADALILPSHPKPSISTGTSRRTFQRDGMTLEAFSARPCGVPQNLEPKVFVLRFTGGDASGSAAFTATRWANRPVEVWVVNYPGYGQSPGPRTLEALARAAVLSFDHLKTIAGDRPIYLEGFSLGTVPALAIAARRPIAGIVLQNPPPLRELILGRHGWWNLWLLAGPLALQIPHDLNSLANARQCTAPAIFILAERDRTIPLPYQKRLFDAYAGPKQLILQRGADHFLPLDQATQRELQRSIDEIAHPQTTGHP